MLSRLRKFKLPLHFTALAAAALAFAGCAALPAQPGPHQPAPSAQPLARAAVPIPDAQHDLLAQLLAGEMALTRTDLHAAAGYYAQAMMLGDDPLVAARAAELALATHDDAGATRALDRWQALGAKPVDLARARAQLALDQGNAAAAQRELERLLATGAPTAWPQFGRVLAGARDHAQAARLLQALATPQRLPAGDAPAWLAMSELGAKLDLPDYALRIAQEAARRFHSAQTYAWEAHLRFAQGDHAGARGLLRQAVAKAPRDTALRLAYADMLGQAKEYAQAAGVLEGGPQDADTYALRAALAAQANDTPALARIYRQLQAARPDVRDASSFLLGQLAEMLHKDDAALEWYGEVDDDDPHAFDADLRSAVLLQKQGRPTEAHQLLERLELTYLDQPEQLRQAYQLDAELYLDGQQYAQAESAFSRALDVVPNDPQLLYGRGLAYAQAGKVDLAVADFQRVLALKPDDVDASNALGFTLADADRDLQEAERLILVARKAKPDDPAIADSWGWLQYRLGHFDQAVRTLRAAWKAQKDPDIGLHLSEALAKQGNRRDAEEVLDMVRRLDPHNPALPAVQKRVRP